MRPLTADVINGRSGAVLAYGQTGAGKTYTVFGEEGSDTSLRAGGLAEAAGLVPRVLSELLGVLPERRAHGFEAQLRMSCVEVFGDVCVDLLGGGASIGAW